MKEDFTTVAARVAPLIGQEAWGAALGLGSFLTLEFGPREPPGGPSGREHGVWHLWIKYCAWRLEEGPEVIAASEDERTKIERGIQRLNGRRIQDVRVSMPALDTVFSFTPDLYLRTFAVFSAEYEGWVLFAPDGHVLVAGPGSDLSYPRATEASR